MFQGCKFIGYFPPFFLVAGVGAGISSAASATSFCISSGVAFGSVAASNPGLSKVKYPVAISFRAVSSKIQQGNHVQNQPGAA
jgi:hypothetical protein